MFPKFDQLDNESQALVISMLPRVGAEIVEIIGFGPALDLFNIFGGTEVYLYQSPPQPGSTGAARFGELAAVIGEENTLRLGKAYRGEERRLYVPRALGALNALKRRQIVAEYDALLKTGSARDAASRLARRFRVSHRQIEKIVNGKHEFRPPGARKP